MTNIVEIILNYGAEIVGASPSQIFQPGSTIIFYIPPSIILCNALHNSYSIGVPPSLYRVIRYMVGIEQPSLLPRPWAHPKCFRLKTA